MALQGYMKFEKNTLKVTQGNVAYKDPANLDTIGQADGTAATEQNADFPAAASRTAGTTPARVASRSLRSTDRRASTRLRSGAAPSIRLMRYASVGARTPIWFWPCWR